MDRSSQKEQDRHKELSLFHSFHSTVPLQSFSLSCSIVFLCHTLPRHTHPHKDPPVILAATLSRESGAGRGLWIPSHEKLGN